MLAALVTSAALAPAHGVYASALAAQVGLYGAAAVGAALRGGRGRVARLLGVPYAFCLLNFTTLVSVWCFATRRQTVQWRKAGDAVRRKAA
jgi:hypothetical protein